MVPTWTPALCPLWLRERRRAREPESRLRGARPPQPKGKRVPRPGGDVSSSSEDPHLQSTSISSPHQGSDLEKRGASAGSCVDARGRWGASSRLPGRRGTGSEEPSSAPNPSRTRLSNKKRHTPSPLSSHTFAAFGLLEKHISSKGQKALFFFFFFNLPVQPGAMESGNQAGRRVGRLLLEKKNLCGRLFSWEYLGKWWCLFLLLLPFGKLHSHGIFCSFHVCKLSRVGLAKGGFAEDCLLLWI